MTGTFIIKYRDGRTEYMAHEYIFSLDPKVKKYKLAPIRRDYRGKLLTFHCACKKTHPFMTLSHHTATDNISIKSRLRSDHDESCPYGINDTASNSPDSLYQKGFIKQANGLIDINFDGQDYRSDKKIEPANKDNDKPSISNVSSKPKRNVGVSRNRPTVYATMWRLLTESWNNLIQFSHKKGYAYPSNDAQSIYKQLINKTIKPYSLKDIPIQQLLYKGEATGKISIIEKDIKKRSNVELGAFTMLLLEDHNVGTTNNMCNLTLKSPVIQQPREINVPVTLYNKAKKAIGNTEGPYFAGGFVESMGYKKTPQFISFALVPINNFGVPVESSYERELYTQLCEAKRPFLKCFESMNSTWNGFIPDGLLLDTRPQTILEVFGMSENIESYHIQRGIKIEHFSKLKPKYDFWYWNAFKEEAPPIPTNK